MPTLFRAIQKIEEALVAGGILVIALLTIGNVLSRSLLGESLAFAEELSQFLIVLVTFVGLGYGASKGRHIRMTALYDQLAPRPRKVLMIFIAASTALLMLVLAYYSVRYVLTVGELGTVSPALRVPLWVVYLAAPLGFVLAAIQYVLAVVRNLTSPGIYVSYEHLDTHETGEEGTESAS